MKVMEKKVKLVIDTVSRAPKAKKAVTKIAATKKAVAKKVVANLLPPVLVMYWVVMDR